MDRHGRQTRLAEVGAAGQERIERASVAVHLDGLAATVAARYLAGAGVGCMRVSAVEAAHAARSVDPNVRVVLDAALVRPAPPSALALHDPVAEAVALGAHTALVALRDVLGMRP